MSLRTTRELILDRPDQLRALGDETRAQIIRLLEDRPSSAKELADLLQMSHGKVGHHVKVLRDAGLIEVVEERPVRALTEKLYGLTFHRLRYGLADGNRLAFALEQAVMEAAPEQPFEPPAAIVTARMSSSVAEQFHQQLMELVTRFDDASNPDDPFVYGMAVSVFLTETSP